MYMPKFEDVRPIKIGSPPPKKELKAELIRVMSNLDARPPGQALIQELRRKDVDVPWMTSLLFMLEPNHRFFDERYTGRGLPRNHVHEPDELDERFAIYRTIFNNMPVPRGRRRPNVANQLLRGDQVRETQAQRLQADVQRLYNVIQANPDLEMPALNFDPAAVVPVQTPNPIPAQP